MKVPLENQHQCEGSPIMKFTFRPVRCIRTGRTACRAKPSDVKVQIRTQNGAFSKKDVHPETCVSYLWWEVFTGPIDLRYTQVLHTFPVVLCTVETYARYFMQSTEQHYESDDHNADRRET